MKRLNLLLILVLLLLYQWSIDAQVVFVNDTTFLVNDTSTVNILQVEGTKFYLIEELRILSNGESYLVKSLPMLKKDIRARLQNRVNQVNIQIKQKRKEIQTLVSERDYHKGILTQLSTTSG